MTHPIPKEPVATADLIERLQARAAQATRGHRPYVAAELSEAAAVLTSLREEVAELRKALEPFANAIDRYDAEWDDKSGAQAREPDDEKITFLGWLGEYFDMVTLGDLRRARTALKAQQ